VTVGDYQMFLEGKRPAVVELGRPAGTFDVHPLLFPHQRAIVEWAVRGGRRAIFAAFGLGKSVMQLETCRLVTPPGGSALIVCPLGVRGEFLHDAAMLGIDDVRFVRRTEELDGPGIYLTNYESVRDGRLDVDVFTTASLDEASVLRSFGSKTYIEFLQMFAGTQYRYVASATPSPNRYKELIHYAGFLGVMDTGQALTRFFQRDSTKAGNLTLYPHKEEEFWLWLASWAVFLQSPADLGFDASGYDLPELKVLFHEVTTDLEHALGRERDGQVAITTGDVLGVSQAASVKRDTIGVRVAEMMRLLDEHPPTVDDQVVIWCDLNDEQRSIEQALTAAGISYSSVFGSLAIEESERRIAAWKDRQTAALVGKPVMLGQGLNLQQANRAVFVGLTFKFNDVIQATHRIYRFGQTRPCFTHIIHADTEAAVVTTINEKWRRHEEMTRTMTDLIRTHGLNDVGITEALLRSMGVERVEASGKGWRVANNDCVLETKSMDTDSVDLIVTSIPFSNHYEYTPSYNDFGHTDDNDHFWSQMDFLTPELLRVLRPGRIYACHVKDRILFGNVTGAGASTVSPFHAEAIMHGRRHGFDYMGMITVVTDVVRENNQSYRLGWSENAKDSTKMGVGSPEYVLLFRKPQSDRSKGYADLPVTKDKAVYSRSRWQVDAHAFWRSNGDRLITPEEWTALGPAEAHRIFTDFTLNEVYDFETHVRIGEAFDELGRLPATFMMLQPASWHPDVWTDVTRMLTLNTEQSRNAQALHVCPLQFDIVDRLIQRFSNEGELVYDPFGGIFTVPYRALALGRQGRAAELNPGYFLDGIKYLQAMERDVGVPTIFDLLDEDGDEDLQVVG
jgi:DNA modification methylase